MIYHVTIALCGCWFFVVPVLSSKTVYCFPMIRETSPAAISGPTGTPRNSATPKIVPTSSPATSCGWLPINVTPRPPSQRQSLPRQSLPAISSSETSESVSRGQCSAGNRGHYANGQNDYSDTQSLFFDPRKKVLNGVMRTMINTRIETATVVLWLIKPSAAKPSRISKVTSNIVVSLPKIITPPTLRLLLKGSRKKLRVMHKNQANCHQIATCTR